MKTFKYSLVAALFLMALPVSNAHATFFKNYSSYYQLGVQQDLTNDTTKKASVNKNSLFTGSPLQTAPEPVSTTLFLTGALIMGVALLRRKKALTA